jgi:hypothetical protein
LILPSYLPARARAIDPGSRIHPLGLPARRTLLEPPVSVDHHDRGATTRGDLMKAIVQERFGPPDVLELVDTDPVGLDYPI